eukprot:jgi/Undpi1/10262/HiC_scaffold_28.g12714.m1
MTWCRIAGDLQVGSGNWTDCNNTMDKSSAESNQGAEGAEGREQINREQKAESRERAASNDMVQDSRRPAGRQRELDRLQQHDGASSRRHACYHGFCKGLVGA